MKDSLKNTFALDEKKCLWFVLARKSVSTTRNKAFVEKYVSTIRKIASSGKKPKMVSTRRWQQCLKKKIGENGFHWPEIKFILAEIGFCINNLFLQGTSTVATHKRRRFLKDIFTKRKICSTSSNKDFLLKLVCH